MKQTHTDTHTLLLCAFLPQGVIRSLCSPVFPQSITQLYDPLASPHTQTEALTPPKRSHFGSSLSTCLSLWTPGGTFFLFLLCGRKRALFLFPSASAALTPSEHEAAADETQTALFSLRLSVSEVNPCTAPVFLHSSNGEHFTRPVSLLLCLLLLFYSSPPPPLLSLPLSLSAVTHDRLTQACI